MAGPLNIRVVTNDVAPTSGGDWRALETDGTVVQASPDFPDSATVARGTLVVVDTSRTNIGDRARIESLRRERPDLPVILVTANPSIEFVLWALRAGVGDVLDKPVSEATLRQSISRVVAHRKAVAAGGLTQSTPAVSPNRRPRTGSRQLSLAINYVEKHHTEEIREAAVAALCGRSPSQFCRDFRGEFGLTFIDYLINFRLAKARALLADPMTPIAEVAVSTGFTDPSYFSRVFRRRVGETPSAYRDRVLSAAGGDNPLQTASLRRRSVDRPLGGSVPYRNGTKVVPLLP